MKLRPWQVDLVGSVLDPDPRPRLAGWMMPRGQGKSTLVAALGLYDLMLGEEGASVVVAATDERQAGIVFSTAAPHGGAAPGPGRARAVLTRTGCTCPSVARRSSACPPSPSGWKGLDSDARDPRRDRRDLPRHLRGRGAGAGQAGNLHAAGDRHAGTGPARTTSWPTCGSYAAEHPDDRSFVWREFSAAGFEDHPRRLCSLLGAGEPGAGRLPPPGRAGRAAAAEDTRGHVPPCPAVPVRHRDTDGAFLPLGVWDGAEHRAPRPGRGRSRDRPRRQLLRRHDRAAGGHRRRRTSLRRGGRVGTPGRRRVLPRADCRRRAERSGTPAAAGAWSRSWPTRSAGPARFRRSKPNGCRWWSSRTPRPG